MISNIILGVQRCPVAITTTLRLIIVIPPPRFYDVLPFGKNSSISSFCLTLFDGFYVLDETDTSPSLHKGRPYIDDDPYRSTLP